MKSGMQNYLNVCSGLILLLLFISSCKNEPIRWKIESDEQVITEYIETHDQFSEFYGLINSANINSHDKNSRISSLLAVRGPFTLFLPDNDAMNAYYIKKGISSYTDLSAEEQANLAMTHIIDGMISSGSIGLGALPEVNAIGDYIVSEFNDADIILNKYSKIIDRDVYTNNGVIHIIDEVLDPVTKSVYQIIAEDPSYSIFKQGIDITGLKDTLQVITFPLWKYTARTRYTILAITDSTFNRFGIYTIDDLVAKYTDDPDNVSDINNGFYRYMEYHCMAGTNYLNDLELESKIYPVLSYENYISITVNDDYKINQNDTTKEYTAFVIDECNLPGKNGTVHRINGLLPVVQQKPTKIVWETTDHFDMKLGDYYGKDYEWFVNEQDTFINIKWEGGALIYNFSEDRRSVYLNGDFLEMMNWMWCQVTTPKIMKGKYRLTSNLMGGCVNYDVYVDGEYTAYITLKDRQDYISWGEFSWDKTETHTVRVVKKSGDILAWDTLTFTPIEDSD